VHKKYSGNHLPHFFAIGLLLFLVSNRIDEFRAYDAATVSIYVIAIASLILLTGFSGQVSLGHGALMAIGAYCAAVARNELNVPIVLCFILAVLSFNYATSGL
jgi:branched-chain amino acid transport system permease protein